MFDSQVFDTSAFLKQTELTKKHRAVETLKLSRNDHEAQVQVMNARKRQLTAFDLQFDLAGRDVADVQVPTGVKILRRTVANGQLRLTVSASQPVTNLVTIKLAPSKAKAAKTIMLIQAMAATADGTEVLVDLDNDNPLTTPVKPDENGANTTKPNGNGNTAVKPGENGSSSVKPDGNGNTAVKPDGNESSTDKPDGNGNTVVKPDENGSSTTKPDGNGNTAVKPDENGSSTEKPNGNDNTAVKPDENGSSTEKPNGNGNTVVKPDENGSSNTNSGDNGNTEVKPDGSESNTEKPNGNGNTNVKPDDNKSNAAKPDGNANTPAKPGKGGDGTSTVSTNGTTLPETNTATNGAHSTTKPHHGSWLPQTGEAIQRWLAVAGSLLLMIAGGLAVWWRKRHA
jgi:LPXTG-motif cell wall-anchored protein